MVDRIACISLLNDFYGQLLTAKQRDVMELYYEENLSLAEIAGEFGISRQGVHDTLKTAEKTLCEYEEKLGLAQKFGESQKAIGQIDASIDEIIANNSGNKRLIDELSHIKAVIDSLEE